MPIFRVKSVKIYTGQKNLHGYIRGIRDKYEVCPDHLFLPSFSIVPLLMLLCRERKVACWVRISEKYFSFQCEVFPFLDFPRTFLFKKSRFCPFHDKCNGLIVRDYSIDCVQICKEIQVHEMLGVIFALIVAKTDSCKP